ncbi:MAG TPA: cysteine--tRNA ligase, partial [Acidimicrobiales bacterium]
RDDWEWHDDMLLHAQSRLATWRSTLTTGRTSSVLDDVRDALDDDLNSPAALRAIDAASHAGSSVAPAAALLGITL